MKTIEQIKADIDTLVRKQGNQGALKLGGILDDIVDIVQNGFQEINNTFDKFKAQITDVATFHAAVPTTATEIVFAFLGDVDLTGYTKSGSIGKGIDVYADGTKYAVVSAKIICAPTSCEEMFYDYSSLTSLNFSNFNTANVENFSLMFYNCSNLTSLDFSNFDTSEVETFSAMFGACSSLTTLDFSNFDTTNSLDFSFMFDSCSRLVTIIATNWNPDVTSMMMFNDCTSLVGGNGTTYNSSHTNAAYAHIDVADNPGYFTAPA